MPDLTDPERRMLLAAKEAGMTSARKRNAEWHFSGIPVNYFVGYSQFSTVQWHMIDDLIEPPMIFDPESERLMRAARNDDYCLVVKGDVTWRACYSVEGDSIRVEAIEVDAEESE